MTAPALPGAAPDPARLPPEVEEALSLALSDAPARGTCDELLLRTAIRAALDKRGEVSPAAGASARALGGDGEPVLTDWDRRLAEFDDDPRLAPAASEVRRVRALWVNEPSADRTKCMDRAIAGAVLRFVDSTRPAATGDTPEVERAARTAALYVDEAWRKGAPKSEWHPIKAMLMRDAIRAATGGHPSEARRGHESEGRGGPDAR